MSFHEGKYPYFRKGTLPGSLVIFDDRMDYWSADFRFDENAIPGRVIIGVTPAEVFLKTGPEAYTDALPRGFQPDTSAAP